MITGMPEHLETNWTHCLPEILSFFSPRPLFYMSGLWIFSDKGAHCHLLSQRHGPPLL